jgi:hypothetical protein
MAKGVFQVKWYKTPITESIGLVILALAASQVLQIILFITLSAIIQEMKTPLSPFVDVMPVVPSIIATLAGGFFLGRVRARKSDRVLWATAALVNALIPLILQVVIMPKSIVSLAQLSVWISFAGNVVLWFAGCVVGVVSTQKKPDSGFDKALIQWTAGITALVVLLFAFTWGSMVFSKGYRRASNIELNIPPDAEEIQRAFFEPGIANSKRFRVNVSAGDTSIQGFYLALMEDRGWIDVTERFQSWPVREWQFRAERINDRDVEYVVSGGHWRDIAGDVAISLVLQGMKVDESADWNDTDWIIQGVVLSRPYREPDIEQEKDE